MSKSCGSKNSDVSNDEAPFHNKVDHEEGNNNLSLRKIESHMSGGGKLL